VSEASTSGQRRWYAVRTHVHQETRAEVQLNNQGHETWLPRIWKSVRHARRIRQVRAPLFPGYLFIRLDVTRQQWRSVNSTFGVMSLIMEGDRPRPVPCGIVDALQALTVSDGLIDFAPDLVPGQQVQVIAGPFAGVIGELATCGARGRVEILLEVMGQQVRVRSQARALMPA
jgi:transcription elongation factor/antiterminator RfaH